MNPRLKRTAFTLIFTAALAAFITAFNVSSQPPDYRLPALYSDDGDGFFIIAHRGASAYYPENTMAAFRGAVAMEAEMIELDVMLSKDGVPVVFHDARLDEHTDGSGYVGDYSLAELRQLDAGRWFGEAFAGERIPTLEQVLAWASGTIALNIEVKTEAVSDSAQGGVEAKSVELVKKYGMQRHVLFSSFDYRAVARLKALDADLPVALLYEKRQSGQRGPHELLQQLGADAFNCSYRELNGRRLQDLHRYKIPFFVYTVDQPGRMRKLIDKGAAGIFTNKPDLLRRVVSGAE